MIPQLSPAESQAWQQRITPLTQECGCNAGTRAVGIFLVIAVLAALFSNISDEVRFPLRTYLIGSTGFLASLVLSALFGKLIGQGLAALRLRRVCRELEKELLKKEIQ